jgi:type I restriction enzyme, S subunit
MERKVVNNDVAELLPKAVRRFKAYPAYMNSGVEWLGEIPAHWGTRRLKHLAALNPESLLEETDPAYEMTYVDIGGVDGLGRIVEREELFFASAPSRARRLVRDGDVIVSTVRTYLRAIAPISDAEPNMVVSTGFAVVRPAEDLTPDYAAYALRAPYFVERVVANSKGVSFPAINESEMATYELAVPPESEQRAIAAFLDRETARIDAMAAKKERLIGLLQEKRTALITRTVTKGLDPNTSAKDSGIEWLGKIPRHWDVKRLWHLTPSNRRIMYGIVLPGPNVDDGVPIVKGGDVSPERLRLDRLNRTTREIESGYVRSRLRGGDLVYAIRGSIGEVAMVPEDLEGANLTQDAARVAYTRATHGPWLLHALKSAVVFAQLEAGALGATIRGINIRDLKRASIPVPPCPEQQTIAAFLDREIAKIDALGAKVRDAIDRLKELRVALISAAVTGKIDVREDVA